MTRRFSPSAASGGHRVSEPEAVPDLTPTARPAGPAPEPAAAGGAPPDVPPDVLPREPRRGRLPLLRAMRPRQWVKNVLIGAAPFAAGGFTEAHQVWQVALAFVAFCLAASSIYLINDTVDVEVDRRHPRKRYRPIAAGQVSPRAAVVTAVVCMVLALGLGLLVRPQLLIVVAVYLAVQLAYCFWLKHEPVLDVAIVASGFLIRAVAGGVAARIPLSQWFLLSAGFGSLFMVAGKRYAERLLVDRTGSEVRRSLQGYTISYLRFVWTLAATVLVTTYGLWAFDIRTAHHSVFSILSMVPFVVAILRYAVDVDSGRAGEPEDIALNDRVLQVLALAWVVTLALAVYT